MELGQPIVDESGRMGTVTEFGSAGPDGNKLVTVAWEPDGATKSFAWRSQFQATDLRTAQGLVWRVLV